MQPRPDYENYTALQRWIVLGAVILGAILEILDTTIVSTAIPQMQGNLGATLDEIGWVSTGYIVANVIMLPLTGWFSGRFGRRQYLAASMAFFTFASLMCGVSGSLWGLVFWRVMQGAGGAALISTAQATLLSIFPPKQHNMVQGLFGLAIMVAPTTGPTIGGYITDQYSWPWAFFVNVPLGIIGVFLVLTFLKDNANQKSSKSVDALGILLLAIGLGCAQVVLEKGNREDWFASTLIVWMTIFSTLGLGGFIWWELKTPTPAVNLRILKNTAFAAGWAFNFVIGVGLYTSVFIFPVFMQSLRGYTAQESGMQLIPRGLTTAIVTIITIRLTAKIQPRYLIGIGSVLFAVSMAYFQGVTLQTGPDQLLWPMIISGAALGMLIVPLSVAALGSLKPQEVPEGAGLFNLMRQLGGSVGIAASATLLDHWTSQARVPLATHFNIYNPAFTQRFGEMTTYLQSRGASLEVAQAQAYQILGRTLGLQASLISFEKAYFALGVVFIAALPLLLFFKKVDAKAGAGEAH
ncbi:MFS transporter, DHA2 family, multidrug resistance protein [Abditibacterium utsteinense]|uniref:MFS transporter, DHA2 family, multidrug resistance protein n=1 Tax=Abditibacterium utsteinense TaxID=1960156 RepID=A0A2S8SSM1_9BACT|nr:DHA2 family efflux MFS transporter permease subunit [Abditibacterium utsteinense]PQV63812.1 MFS transporter, DHA2 family, multidrug resistance protein [Abditibacterium utsteinense]